MSSTSPPVPADFPTLLKEIKDPNSAGTNAGGAGCECGTPAPLPAYRLHHCRRQHKEGWGAAGISRLATELGNELPQEKGFSERNIKRMLAF